MKQEPSLRWQVRGTGLVVVRDGKVVGLHCSGPELHAGQAAIIQHGGALAGCQLYFSRRPCATCLKMIINGEERLLVPAWRDRTRRSPRSYACCSSLSSGRQPDFLLARGPRGERPEVHLCKLPRSARRGDGGGPAGRHGDRDTEVQRSSSHLRAAAAPRSRPGAVYL